MAIKKLDKLPKRKVTVDELLGLDNINKLISDLDKRKASIEEIIVIYTDSDNNIIWKALGLDFSRMLSLFEQVKYGEIIRAQGDD